MVTTVTAYTDTRNRALPGTGFDGVVRVSVGGHYGTGALLYDGRAILTAAHLFANVGAASTSILFETSAGSQTLAVSDVKVLSTYDATQTNDDLALVWLSGSAPVSAERYGLYRGSDEIAQTLTMVGYGLPGTGLSGALNSYNGSPLRLKATNQFDGEASTLKNELGSVMGWTPTAGSQLIADFDNGTSAQDALGRLINRPGTGLGQDEGLVAPGDSGGPAFINGQLAGVASYTASLGYSSINPDIDTITNSSYGEIAAWQRVSHYQQWIDQSVRAHYPNAPTKPADVQKVVNEGGSGSITYAYFLLQFTGVRSNPEQKLSVDFSTRNGTAAAGQDYIPVKGTLVIYPDESQAVIPVEVIGDSVAELDEFFYLDVTNPVGGSFGDGVITLTAIRTIANDDGSV